MTSRVATNELHKKQVIERLFNKDLLKIFYEEKDEYIKQTKITGGYLTFTGAVVLQESVNRHFKRIKNRILNKNSYTEPAYKTYEIIENEKVYNDVVSSFNKLAESELQKAKKKEGDTLKQFNAGMTSAIPIRTLLISNVETQPVYESAKLINAIDKDDEKPEAEITGSSIAYGTLGMIYASTLKKVWRSAFRPTTRDAHARADGQTVFIHQPFTVNGQMLMYPGDSKYATPDNFMNCYCSVEYKL